MSLVLDGLSIGLGSAANDVFPPRLGAENLLRASDADVSVSTEQTGGEKENAYAEGFTYDFWQPTATGSGRNWIKAYFADGSREVNYLGVAAHNLNSNQGSVQLQYSQDAGVTWSNATTEYMPPDSSPIMIVFDSITAGDWRVMFKTSDGTASIGVVAFGKALEFISPIAGGWRPPYLARSNRYVNEVSEGGAYLGRSLIAQGAVLDLQITALSLDWIRDYWEPAVRTIESYPFFFCARDADQRGGVAESEVFYGWAASQPAARYANQVYGSISLQARGIIT